MKIATLAFALLTVVPMAHAATLYTCPNQGSSGDQVDRGFYVTNYPGSTLDTVTLNYTGGSGDGAYTVSLTPRLSVYGGTIIGSTQTKIVNVVAGAPVLTTFNFSNAPVPAGSTVTFTQVLVSGPVASPVMFYDVGVGPCTDVTQTNGTSPPLDSFRRNSVGLTITSLAGAGAAAGVPTLSQYGLLLLASLLAVGGIVVARRRS